MADQNIPDAVRELAGRELFGGNLRIYPLEATDPETLTVANASDKLRSWEWRVPDEMVIFGDNGQSDSFGLWLPLDGGARPIVVQIGEVFEDACLAVVGDDFESFLRGWGDYYTQLSSRDLDDDDFYEILGGANPALPDPRPDPYERGLTAALRRALRSPRGRPSPSRPTGSRRRARAERAPAPP